MHHFWRVIILMLFWAAFQGSFTPGNLLIGALLGGIVTWFVAPLYEDMEPLGVLGAGGFGRYVRQAGYLVVLAGVFLKELVLASVKVAAAVLRPTIRIVPGIVAVPLDAETELEITTLANLISLTPGTLSLDVSADRTRLYVHTMFSGDAPDDVARQIKRSLEQPVIRALGQPGPG